MSENLLEVRNLTKYFPVKGSFFRRSHEYVHAVDDISFSLHQGETLGLVGESGCGKSTLARSILRLVEPDRGEILFSGKNICLFSDEEMRQVRKQMQIVFQDPFASLNPRMTVDDIIGQAIGVHGIAKGAEKKDIVETLLEKVGIGSHNMGRYPHEFSGGQRQRIGIARALALKPKFLVGDEPVSALDVSIRAQILNLMERLKGEFDLSYIIISHDLAVIRHISDRVGVMYLGKLVEIAESRSLYTNPLHPYTQALLSAVPTPDPESRRKRIILKGDVPNPVHPPSGCRFHTRCSSKKEICQKEEPHLREIEAGHFVACFLEQ